MDSVVLDGVQYVKASVAAKEFRYTSDYIGQLCRSKKIDARLVGRTWFVNADSIRDHKQAKYQKSSQAVTEKTLQKKLQNTEKQLKTKPYRKQIVPVMTSKTAKSVARDILQKSSNLSESRRLIVWYEPDQETLIPNLTKRIQPSKTVRIQHVDAKKVKVSSNKAKEVTFVPSVMPDVALSGKLTITSFPDKVTKVKPEPEVKKTQKTFKIKDISDDPDSVKVNKVNKGVVAMTAKTNLSSKKAEALKKPDDSVNTALMETGVPASINPESKNAHSSPFTPVSVQKPVEVPISSLVRLSPLIATFAALVCVTVIFSASAIVTVSDSLYQSQVTLQVANLLEIFSQY